MEYAKEKASAEEIVDAIETIKNDSALEAGYRENAEALLRESFL